jgi:hypothetical protein
VHVVGLVVGVRVQRLAGEFAEVGQLAGGGVDFDQVFRRGFGNARLWRLC